MAVLRTEKCGNCLLAPISHIFRNSHPAMKEMKVPPRVMDFLAIFDGNLKGRRFVAGDRFIVADITGLVGIDFMKPAKLAVPETLGHLKRWHAEVSARPSAQA